MEGWTLFFDLGGTLLIPARISARRRIGHILSLSEKELKPAGRLIMTSSSQSPETLAGELARLLVSKSPFAVLDAVRSVWREQMDQVRLHPEAVGLIKRLKARSFGVGLLSNVWPPVLHGIEAGYPGFLSLFDHRVLSCRLGVKKPAAGIFEAAVDAAGVHPRQTVMIGDSYELDMAPAVKAGMRTVWVLSRPEAERELLARVMRKEEPAPDSAVGDISELPQVLESLLERKDASI